MLHNSIFCFVPILEANAISLLILFCIQQSEEGETKKTNQFYDLSLKAYMGSSLKEKY